jgi:hypothetical protein
MVHLFTEVEKSSQPAKRKKLIAEDSEISNTKSKGKIVQNAPDVLRCACSAYFFMPILSSGHDPTDLCSGNNQLHYQQYYKPI